MEGQVGIVWIQRWIGGNVYSENTQHWDSLCLGTVTIATAALGVVVLAAGGSDISVFTPAERFTLPGLVRAVFAAIAIIAYLVLVGAAGVAIYRVTGCLAIRHEIKRRLGNWVYWLFAVEIAALAFMLGVNPVFGLIESLSEPGSDYQQTTELLVVVFDFHWRQDDLVFDISFPIF